MAIESFTVWISCIIAWIATSKTRRYAVADQRYPIADWWYAQLGIFKLTGK